MNTRPTIHTLALPLLVGGLCVTATLAWQEPETSPPQQETELVGTPAERAIAIAEHALETNPESLDARAALAFALSRRARETADPAWYDRSDAVLDAAGEGNKERFELQKIRVWNQLGRHEFTAAHAAARALNERAKDDVVVYGLIVDATVELGLYAEAEEAAQWMLNLRPGTPAAMTRVSYLRELFGDVEGAVQAMRMAYHSTRSTELEDRAWMLTHLAHLELERGKPRPATALVQEALALFPDYHYALAELARCHALNGDARAAVEALERRYAVASHPENLYELAVALVAAGDHARAKEAFAEFETDAVAESQNLDNANLQLAEYWLDHTQDVERWARALQLTEARVEARQDLASLELHGWALHRAGESDAAAETLQRAVAVGCVRPELRLRAGLVFEAAGRVEDARQQFEVAYQQSPRSHAGREALRRLAEVGGTTETGARDASSGTEGVHGDVSWVSRARQLGPVSPLTSEGRLGMERAGTPRTAPAS
jgi:tetratricopeptide (TPR) repeat protein